MWSCSSHVFLSLNVWLKRIAEIVEPKEGLGEDGAHCTADARNWGLGYGNQQPGPVLLAIRAGLRLILAACLVPGWYMTPERR